MSSTDDPPTEETLKTIREWNMLAKGYKPLMDLVGEQWWMPEWGWDPSEDGFYSISTGGWSGNEVLIEALHNNYLFWSLCWVSSHRGGHYEFELPKP